MDDHKLIFKRLLQSSGAGSPAAFARIVGIKPHSVYPAVQKGRIPPSWLIKISELFDISVDWLLTGEGIPSRSERAAASGLSSDYALISVHSRQKDGEKALSAEVVAFNRPWIEDILGLPPDHLRLVHVQGDAMEPTLRAGDLALVHLGPAGPVRDGLYAIEIGDSILIKRLQALPGGTIKVISDSPAFESFSIGPEESRQMTVVGRVVWTGRKV
ncbi:MAG: helix-turn-helix domain-containing protein [Proteobacteria bacterium]|nr:helix-turn-helix domain-containing protein [Pseudomonadota bacterium]